jgi:hypothetical protein
MLISNFNKKNAIFTKIPNEKFQENKLSYKDKQYHPNIPKMAYSIYLTDSSKYMGIKILTTVIKQKYKIWIGRTELQL